MKREIKFRAWDKKNNKMLGVSEIGNLMFAYGENYDHITKYEADIMQFTGLLDKNGKEIYEGDIVNCNLPKADWTLEENKKFAVQWSDILLGFTNGSHGFLYEYSDFEVIGNIYENPELITNN